VWDRCTWKEASVPKNQLDSSSRFDTILLVTHGHTIYRAASRGKNRIGFGIRYWAASPACSAYIDSAFFYTSCTQRSLRGLCAHVLDLRVSCSNDRDDVPSSFSLISKSGILRPSLH